MLKIEISEGVALVRLANPPLNLLHPIMAKKLRECFASFEFDNDVNVVVLTGDGEKAFCAGFDIKMFPPFIRPNGGMELSSMLNRSLLQISNLGKPTIAAINGLALGGGLEIALACDIRYASVSAKMGQPEIKLGLIPGAGGTQRLSRLIGPSLAKEMIYLGDPIESERAFRIGLVNRVLDDTELMSSAMETATKISTMPGVALRHVKRAVDEGSELPLESALHLESRLFDAVMISDDCKEGVNAFTEKRRPDFRSN